MNLKPTSSFKVVLLGHISVGKTCLVKYLLTGEYDSQTETTINATYSVYDFELENQIIKLQIWDTAGEEKLQNLAPIYYHGAMGALVVYDITESYSFTRAKFWINELHRHGSPNVTIILVGNKADKESERAVSLEEVENYANENSITHIQTSAKSGENVIDTFRALAQKISKATTSTQNRSNSIFLHDKKKNEGKKKGCC
ncbi:ras-related protein rab-5c [Anaeramoeba ignava]|uniref:Ras-related protein rab-5c n=1 Tax=Anaeramoeba ignava TaxID=1746090 RepID=A0A9Q0LNQ6_ANAIG|nr:ras-related protein rab-5c [Anaeramoeba ignava]